MSYHLLAHTLVPSMGQDIIYKLNWFLVGLYHLSGQTKSQFTLSGDAIPSLLPMNRFVSMGTSTLGSFLTLHLFWLKKLYFN